MTPYEISQLPMIQHLDQPLPATDEQLAVFQALLCPEPGQQHLIVNACAGSSKTTTMVEGVNRLVAAGASPRDILCLAFNKSIADTLAEKMPTGTTSRTINALGHGALKSYFGSARIDQRKVSRVMADTLPGYWDLPPAERRIMTRGIDLAKMNGIWPTPDDWKAGAQLLKLDLPYPQLTKKHINPLEPASFFHTYLKNSEGEELEIYSEYLNLALSIDILQSFSQRTFSFTDQIYLPATVAGIAMPRYLNTFIDEAQDLSRIEQNLLNKIVSVVPKGRLVAVGDKAQAIYAFKGADPEAFARLGSTWQAHKLDLSISFRCPHAVVAEARRYDDRIRAWDQSPEGQVFRLRPGQWSFSNLPSGTAILCRMNYPLVQAAITCIKNNTSVEFLGRDLANQLTDFFQLHSKKIKSMAGLWLQLETQLRDKEINAPHQADRFSDNMECLRSIADFYQVVEIKDLEQAIARFFSMEGNLKLATIHKSKGLEFDHVALLRPDLCPSPRAETPEDLEQEHNMLYVAITRAKQTFTYLEGGK